MRFKNILYFILISTLIGFISCAKDDVINDKPSPDDNPKEKIDSPKSVVVNSNNISMPGSGTSLSNIPTLRLVMVSKK